MHRSLGDVIEKMTRLIKAVDAALAAGSVANALASVQENEARQALQAVKILAAATTNDESSSERATALTAN